ncbi:MAG: hypothetical protein MUD06_07670 [Rhodospirillales bacterium]|jgi:hypothetical protein|nr:hypothetical protein [Rhodospirillales bacterium]
MPLWRIEPVADADDPGWQGRVQWQSVVVRAASPAFARLLASALDTPNDANRYGVENPNLGSGFFSEKLYWVVPETSGQYEETGPDGVVAESRRLFGPAAG